MSRVAYVNGRYVPHVKASVHIEDRGFQFADAVYEVCAVRGGLLIDEEGHLNRLWRSLNELRIRPPRARETLPLIMREVARRNLVADGLVYMQVSRGVARRDHGFPSASTEPTLVITARSLAIDVYERLAESGVRVVTQTETRWARCDIKSTSLLANVLAKQSAREVGAYEAWFVDRDGFVTEGSSTNAWIVDEHGALRTRHLSQHILPGVTRAEILPLCTAQGIQAVERAFRVEEAHRAREAFITAASLGALPVTQIDGQPVGDGRPGPLTAKLRQLYWTTRSA